MSKSSFSALVEAKKQRDGGLETEEAEEIENTAVENTADKEKQERRTGRKSEKLETELNVEDKNPITEVPRANKRETVRRSYRVEETHDKAIKVMSKFMGQGTEEEIVLSIFRYFFENNTDGKKAVQIVELLGNR